MFLCVWTGNKGVEIIELIAFFGISGMVLGVFVWVTSRISGPKKAKNKGDNSISDLYDVYNTQVKDVLKIKDNQIASLTRKLKDSEEESIQGESDINTDEAKFEEITQIVKTQYPKMAPLLIVFKKQIMDATKGLEISEILGYVKTFTGSKQSQGTPDPQSAEYNANWA